MRLRPKLFALFATLVLVVAGCGDKAADRLNGVVHTFADALSKGDASAAAAVTTDPAQASDTLGKLFDSLGRNAHIEVTAVDRKDNEATLRLGPHGNSARMAATYGPTPAPAAPARTVTSGRSCGIRRPSRPALPPARCHTAR
jgi:hypothetical protein